MRASWVLSVLAFFGLAACEASAPKTVRTSRDAPLALSAPESEDVFHFAIYGDRTGGPASGVDALRRAVVETNLIDPDLVMTVGDLVQGYNETPQWLEQMREYRSVMSDLKMPWYPVAGNHDVYWSGGAIPPGHHEANYEAHFGPLWYWFGHKNAAFIVLYSDEGDFESNRKGFREPTLIRMSELQLSWLESALAETADYDHVFVFLHHPRWITDRYRDGNWESVHQLLAASGNVSAVFAGHIHRQRYDGTRDGIAYFTLATIGGRMPMDVPGTGWLNHMLLVTVRPGQFEVATLPIGAVLDPKAMTPEHLDDLNRARRTALERLSDHLLLGYRGGASGDVRYQLRNTASRPLDVTISPGRNAGDWVVDPGHRHIRLEPDEAREIKYSLQRHEDDFAGVFSIPTFLLQVDYLGENRRISFPELAVFAPVKPGPLPPSLTPASEPVRQALRLDGRGGALWFGSDVVEIDSVPFTVEAFIRPDKPEQSGAVIGKFSPGGFALSLRRGRPQLFIGLQGDFLRLSGSREHAVKIGRWHHIAGVVDGIEAQLYLDGRLIARKELPPGKALKPNLLPMYVGANPAETGAIGSPFQGAIDEVRISTVARYEELSFRPSARFEPDGETALLLHLDGDGGPFARDASYHGRHGIGVGAVEFVAR